MYSTKKTEPAKKLTLKDFPILERSQFFFVEKTPMKSELLQFIHESGIRASLSDRYDRMPKNCKLAKNILYDKTKPLVYKTDLITLYDYDVIENAKLYFQNWIKMPAVNEKDHLACIGWFISQLVDIDETAKLNQWDVYDPDTKRE